MRAILLASLFFVASTVFASPEILRPVNGSDPDLSAIWRRFRRRRMS